MFMSVFVSIILLFCFLYTRALLLTAVESLWTPPQSPSLIYTQTDMRETFDRFGHASWLTGEHTDDGSRCLQFVRFWWILELSWLAKI